jgi:hypothetical protein
MVSSSPASSPAISVPRELAEAVYVATAGPALSPSRHIAIKLTHASLATSVTS